MTEGPPHRVDRYDRNIRRQQRNRPKHVHKRRVRPVSDTL